MGFDAESQVGRFKLQSLCRVGYHFLQLSEEAIRFGIGDNSIPTAYFTVSFLQSHLFQLLWQRSELGENRWPQRVFEILVLYALFRRES